MTRAARAVAATPPSPKKIDPAAARAHLKALTSSVGAGEKITAKLEQEPAQKDHQEHAAHERSPA